MTGGQQMLALIIFAWIGLACVVGAASVALIEFSRLLIRVVSDYWQMWRRAA